MITAFRILLIAVTVTGSTSLVFARESVSESGTARSLNFAKTSIIRQVTAVGTTKPPGAVLDDRLGTSTRLEAANMRLALVLRTAICHGC